MGAKRRQFGITLTEMVVVIAVVALLAVLGLPAIRAVFHSFESADGARAMISSALATARAIAAKEQRYAGVRFQTDCRNGQVPLNAPQYMILIVQDPKIGAWFFRAVQGMEPIKLPDAIGVMDLMKRSNVANPLDPDCVIIDSDAEINNVDFLRDTTSFSIIFSPVGKLVIHQVSMRNRDGEPDTSLTSSNDDIFNKIIAVNIGTGMFYQDDYASIGLGRELSRYGFIIYDKKEFKQAYDNVNGLPWTNCLAKLVSTMIYINSYTGTIINR